jgi:uncharacterized MAPEG superfamily protein
MFLWAFSGVARARSKKAINPEDAERFGVPFDEREPPEVARVLRAHANAQTTIYPFLFLGLVYVLGEGNVLFGEIVFAGFVVARIAHSVVYLAAKQPWRTILFTLSALLLFVLLGGDVLLLVRS